MKVLRMVFYRYWSLISFESCVERWRPQRAQGDWAKGTDRDRTAVLRRNPQQQMFAYSLSGPISRDIAILSLRYPISRDTFSGRLALPQNGAIHPPWYLILHRHICAIPNFATYRAIIVRYPQKQARKSFCDTIATSVTRYEQYRCWASKHIQSQARGGRRKLQAFGMQRLGPWNCIFFSKNVGKPNRHYFSKKYRNTPPICISPPICIAVLLVSLRSEEREILSVLLPFVSQYASHLYCNTPLICIAVLLEQPWWLWSPGCSPFFGSEASKFGAWNFLNIALSAKFLFCSRWFRPLNTSLRTQQTLIPYATNPYLHQLAAELWVDRGHNETANFIGLESEVKL